MASVSGLSGWLATQVQEYNHFNCYSSSLGLCVITAQIIYFEKNQVKIRQALAKNPFWKIRNQKNKIPDEVNLKLICTIHFREIRLNNLFRIRKLKNLYRKVSNLRKKGHLKWKKMQDWTFSSIIENIHLNITSHFWTKLGRLQFGNLCNQRFSLEYFLTKRDDYDSGWLFYSRC